MTSNMIFQELVSKIKSNSSIKELNDFIYQKISSFSPQEKIGFLNERTEQEVNILALSANQSPECLQVILNSTLLDGLEGREIYAVLNIKNNHGYSLLDQVARTSPNHIKVVLNSNAFSKLESEYRLKSLIEKNEYDISFIEYALKHESSAFIKAVFNSIQDMSDLDIFKILTLKDSDNIELFMSAVNSSIEHFKAIINKEILQKLPQEALEDLLLKDRIDGNSLLSFTALNHPLTKLNILLDRYKDLHFSGESILNLFTHKNDDGKKLVEITVYKGPDYMSSIFNHDLIFKQLNSTQQLDILTTYDQSGEPILIAAFYQSPEHVKAIIKSDTFLNLSPQEVIQIFGVKDQLGDTFLEVLHAKGSENYIKILQDSEVFHSLNYELQSQILEQIGIHYSEFS